MCNSMALYLFVCLWEGGLHTMMCIWSPEDNLGELSLSSMWVLVIELWLSGLAASGFLSRSAPPVPYPLLPEM